MVTKRMKIAEINSWIEAAEINSWNEAAETANVWDKWRRKEDVLVKPLCRKTFSSLSQVNHIHTNA